VVDGFSSRQTMRRHVIAQTVSDNGVAALFEPLAGIGPADKSAKGAKVGKRIYVDRQAQG